MSTAALPSEFDLEFASEHARFLRRRFMWLCAVSILLSIAFDFSSVRDLRSAQGPTLREDQVSVCGMVLGIAVYGAGLVYAWRAAAKPRTIFRLAFWCNAASGFVTVIYVRLALTLNPPPGAASPAQWAAMMAPFFVLFHHLLPCLFIPWSVRESLRLGVTLLGGVALVAAADMARRHIGAAAELLSIIASALTLTPGLLICWWRYSRYRNTFQLRFESTRYRRLQQELAGARRVHESCLPPQVTQGPLRLCYVYEPMRQIGGDLIYTHPRTNGDGLESDRSGARSVVLLDVTGHGIAAALTVNRLMGELERLFAESPGASPGDILCRLNQYVYLTLASHSIYATALCLRADTDHGTLQWASGGHPPAFLRRGDGTVAELPPTAFMLGVEPPSDFTADQKEIPFNRSDALLAYTDGATEAADPDGKYLGTAGVRQLLDAARNTNPADWPSAILGQVTFHRKAPPSDDTLVAVLFRTGH